MNERYSPTPDTIRAGKDRLARGERLPEGAVARPFTCRSCGREERGAVVPRGWYSLSRHAGPTKPPLRLGLYCSVACLDGQLPRLSGIERDTADGRWSETPFR